jgi:hypothetical protein
MAMAHRHMLISEQNREPRNKPIHIWSIDICQKHQEYTMRKVQFLDKWNWETGLPYAK